MKYFSQYTLFKLTLIFLSLSLGFLPLETLAHGVTSGDKAFIEGNQGLNMIPFIYLGAKHMVTGYDHLLFLFGVIFFLRRLKDVAIYVTLFAVGHSVTLLYGVLSEIHVNAYLVDAVIGFSVVYKAMDNLDMFKRYFGYQPNNKLAVWLFGLIHGFGLATKLQDFELSPDGLVGNIISFNIGVESGQLLALSLMLIILGFLRQSAKFSKWALWCNLSLVTAGVVLIFYQLTGYFITN